MPLKLPTSRSITVSPGCQRFSLISLAIVPLWQAAFNITDVELEAGVIEFIKAQRVARLATVDEQGRPHVVPVCFAYADGTVYSVLDAKPKRVAVRELRRVLNLLANPNVQLLFDHYVEDWSRLAYVQLRGRARLIESGGEQQVAIVLLRQRYEQYRAIAIDEAPVIAVAIDAVVVWGV
jgi:PPOX class probable F420-dependent enzyme